METENAAVAVLRKRVDYWAKRLRLQPRVVRIQPMTRKWGSCSTAGTVTLAKDLAAHPARFQDVVIVHELLHLRVRNHGKLFRALMGTHVPQWRHLSSDGLTRL
jgi:predicted metal-dependent hydrolase